MRPPLRTRPLGVALVLWSVLVLVACGEDREGGVTVEGGTGTATARTETTGTETEAATAPRGKPVVTIAVREVEYALRPPNPEIPEPGVVEFDVRNAGKVVHALEVEGPKGEVETEEIQPGKTASLKADLSEPGTYVWYCPVGNHKDLGMRGELTVARGRDGSGSGGATAPDTGEGQSPGGY